MRIALPELSLVVLAGVSSSGKSTLARRWFAPTEVLSADACRALVADDQDAQDATADAFDVLGYVAGKRLERRRIAVVDATSVKPEDRASLVALAREHDVLACAIVLDVPVGVCVQRNAGRTGRQVPNHALRRQAHALDRSRTRMKREGFHHVWWLDGVEEVEAAQVERVPLWTDRRADTGPFDVIGDVHGCHAELVALLERLGWTVEGDRARSPEGRTAVFVGDLVDRGPATPAVLRLIMGMVRDGVALCVPGNHDEKLGRALRGRNVQVAHGLAESLRQLADEPEEFRAVVASFLDGLVSHYVLDGGHLVVAHAGLTERLQGRSSRRVREFALYGDTTGETDELGLPVRGDWAAGYRGSAAVVYGHTPVHEPAWVNNTINVDSGCVFGGRLTALRWPERELVSVPARATYAEPARPFHPAASDPASPPAGPVAADLLDVGDVLGKRIVQTRLRGAVTVREEQASAALEVMSRFALDPRWLVYLPPTMAPVDASRLEGLLEHPADAFAHYRTRGVTEVVCEEKHMGSRAVVVVGGDEAAVAQRFGIEAAGACWTRTGRRFFTDDVLESAVIGRLRDAVGAAGLWDELTTDWLLLDAELLPWSAKADELVRRQYAAVGASAQAGLAAGIDGLERAVAAGAEADGLLDRHRGRAAAVAAYTVAYRRYVWEVTGVDDLRLAPFHVFASEGAVHIDRDHGWHLATAGRLADADREAGGALLTRTSHVTVDLSDPDAEAAATAWWLERTEEGAEGMVVKPAAFVPRGRKGLLQPALKVRGREYLRIVYGPEYTAPEHLGRLRERGVGRKRNLALREFALGIEALERFVRREPLHRVHECVFAVLALESEPVDPRL